MENSEDTGIKPRLTFTIDCGPGTTWKCRVFVWPSIKAMRREYSPKNRVKSDCVAFCRQFSAKDAWKKQLACEMHFHTKGLTRAHIVHEAVHAALGYARLVKLDIETRKGEEDFTESAEHLASGTLWLLKNKKLKVKQQ